VADDEQPDRSAFDCRGRDSDAAAADDPGAGDDATAVDDPSAGDGVTLDADGETGGDAADHGRGGEQGDAVTPAADSRPRLADLDRGERVELGVALLAHLERESLPLPDAVDRIETVTTNPALTREILDTAELRGIVDREDGRLRVRRGGTFVRFDEAVVRRTGDYECRRCGAGLETGHFVRFEAGELGPFGPECVRRVLGRS